MHKIIKGKVFKVGDDINADYIIPAKYLDLYEPEDLSRHVFEGLGEGYPEMLKQQDVIVSGENFGLGSAREQAPNALKGAGVKAIVAKSFARIFYRNTINVGIPAIECPEAANILRQGDEVEIDLDRGIIVSCEKNFFFKPFSHPVKEILDTGGMVPFLKKELKLAV